jgi:hypothetical protein
VTRGRLISRPPPTQNDADKDPCLECYSNPRSHCSSDKTHALYRSKYAIGLVIYLGVLLKGDREGGRLVRHVLRILFSVLQFKIFKVLRSV